MRIVVDIPEGKWREETDGLSVWFKCNVCEEPYYASCKEYCPDECPNCGAFLGKNFYEYYRKKYERMAIRVEEIEG